MPRAAHPRLSSLASVLRHRRLGRQDRARADTTNGQAPPRSRSQRPGRARRRPARARPEPGQRRHAHARSTRTLACSARSACSPPSRSPASRAPTVGAVVGALLLTALAVAVWPSSVDRARVDPSRAREHLARSSRSDAARAVAWDATPPGPRPEPTRVQLMLVRCAPACRRLAGAPSPYSRELRQRHRRRGHHAVQPPRWKRCAPRPPSSNSRPSGATAEDGSTLRNNRAGTRLDATDRAPRAVSEAAEAQARSDLAEQRADERRAQADAVARALRRRYNPQNAKRPASAGRPPHRAARPPAARASSPPLHGRSERRLGERRRDDVVEGRRQLGPSRSLGSGRRLR